MYWSNTHKLAEDLQEGRVDEKEQFKYYFATFATLSIVVPIFFYTVGALRIDDLICLVVSAIIGSLGIILCYRVNRSGDNIDFVPRMICLTWTGICRFVIICALLSVPHFLGTAAYQLLLFLSYEPNVPQRITETWRSWGSLSMPILVVFYYGFLYYYLILIAEATEGRFLVDMVTSDLSLGRAALGLLMYPGAMLIFALALLVTDSYITKLEGSEVIAGLAALSVTGLWLILIGWSFAVLYKRSMKHGSIMNSGDTIHNS